MGPIWVEWIFVTPGGVVNHLLTAARYDRRMVDAVNEPAMTRREAQRRGLPRYVGRVCHRHPEARGARFTVNGTCLGCDKAFRDRPATRDYNREYVRARRQAAKKATR